MTSSEPVSRVGRGLARLSDKHLAPPVQDFAEHLRDLRQRAGLTSQRLERELGMASASLSRYLSGERLPRLAWLRRFQDWLAANTEAGLTPEERTTGRNLLYAAALTKNIVIARELELDQLDNLWAERITKVEQNIDTVQSQLASLRADQATDHDAITDLEARLSHLHGLVTLLQNDRHGFAEMAAESTATLTVYEPEVATEAPTTGTTVQQPRIWGAVPHRNPDFVGRDGLLDRLRTRLAEPLVLHGMVGVGKTQVVVEHLHRHAAEYDLVWWVQADNFTQIQASLAELAQRMGVPGDGVDVAIRGVLDTLRTGERYRRWILVFDNTDVTEAVRWVSPTGLGQVLVTSRNEDWHGIARTVEVGLLSREESKALLLHHNHEIGESDADTLADRLGDLPLALDQAASWLARTGMPVAEYLRLFDRDSDDLLRSSALETMSVATAWDVPLLRLRNDHPAALEMLQLCSFFGWQPIPRDWLASGDSWADPVQFNNAVRALRRHGLVNVDRSDNTLQVHRVIQLVVRNQLGPDERDTMRRIAHQLMLNGDPGDPADVTMWPRYATLLPHAFAARAVDSKDARILRLVENLVRYLLNSGNYRDALALTEQAHRARQLNFGENEPPRLIMEAYRGTVLSRVGRVTDAARVNERTLDLMRTSFGENHAATIDMFDRTRFNVRAQGLLLKERDQAIETFSRARELLGEDDRSTLWYASSLAECHRLAGEYVKARELDEDTVQRTIAVLGPNHRQTLRAQCGLAMSIRECGQYEKACRLQADINARLLQVLGPDHPLTVGGQRSLAVALRRAQLHKEAWAIVKSCHQWYLQRYGESHVDTITALMDKAILLRQSDHHQAWKAGEQALKQFDELYGAAHPFTLIAATNLAVTCRLMGDAEESRNLNEGALVGLRDKVGADHPYTLVARAHLAGDSVALGAHGRAYELDMDGLRRAERKLGEGHPIALAFKHNVKIDRNLLRRNLEEEQPLTEAAGKVRMNCDTDTMQL